MTSAELREPSLQISTVPEVTVAEDHQAMLREHDVGAAGQPWNVEPVAKAAAPELTSKGELTAGVCLGAGASRRLRCILGRRVQARERWGAALARRHRRPVYRPGWPRPAFFRRVHAIARETATNMRFDVRFASAIPSLPRGRALVAGRCP
jgi:hypothetical protein